MAVTTDARFRPRLWPILVLLSVPMATESRAQEPARATLSLEEAITLARRNSPAFRIIANDESQADWQVREAYANFLPTSNASVSFGYQGEGQPLVDPAFQGLGISRIPEYYSSSYSLGVNYDLSAADFFQLGEARASRKATLASIEAAERTLELDVTRQYLAVLRARDGVELERQNLASARENEGLAIARQRLGAGTQLEVRQAEVQRGRAEVALLEAEHRVRTERLRLMELLGVEIEQEIVLTSDFEVFEPRWEADALIAEALSSHPQLRSLRAAESAGSAAKRAVWGSFLPTISASVGWRGFTQQVGNDAFLLGQAQNQVESQRENCAFWNEISAGLSQPLTGYPQDCSAIALTPEAERAIIADNDVFPFEFVKQPLFARVQVSIPLFTGLSRRRQLEAAEVAADDARERRRAEELVRRRTVAEALLGLETAYRRVQLEERNVEAAAEQLRLARQRYRLGAGSFIELTQAEAANALAVRDHLGAVYTFHESLVALEAAVGRPLRDEAGTP